MENKNIRKSVLSGLLLTLILIQTLSIIDFGLGQEDLDDENDLEFQIVGNMNITSQEMTGSSGMGIGTYTIQDFGTFNRWYREPTISGGTFELNNLRYEFEDINEPFYQESVPQYFNVSNTTSPGKFDVNSTEIQEYSIANDKISQLKVNFEYNMSYPENNVTTITDDFGSVVGDLDSLNDTDGDNYEIHTEFEYAQKYNISDVVVNYGSVSGDLNDLKDDFILPYYTLTSETRIGDSSDVGAYWVDNYHDSAIDPYFHYVNYGYDVDMNAADDYGHLMFFENWHGYASYLYCAPQYRQDHGITGNWNDYNRARVGVRWRWKSDFHNVLIDSEPDTMNVKLQFKNQLTGSWITWSNRETETEGVYSVWYNDYFNLYGSDIEKYLAYGRFEFRLLIHQEGTHWIILPEFLKAQTEVDYVFTSFYGKREINVKLESENVINYGRVSMMANSIKSYSITTPGTTAHWNSIGFYDGEFETNMPNPLHYITISAVHESSFTIDLSYVAIWDRREFQKANQSFGFDFTGQNALDNEYNVSIRYKASNSDVFEFSYGNEFFDQEYELISTLDSTTWTTEEFQITSVNLPQLNIFCQVSTYDYLLQPDLNISIDEINITAIYFPISQVNVTNFNYTYDTIVYTENFTLGFDAITPLNQTHGNLSFIFTSQDFSLYDPLVPKAFTIPEQNLTLNISFPFQLTFNASLVVKYSGVEWISSSEAGLTLNDRDVLPITPTDAYLELLDYPSSVIIDAEVVETRFTMTSIVQFDFSADLEIIARRVMKKSITLNSDHSIFIEQLEFDHDLELYSCWIDGFSYEIEENNIVYPGIIIAPGDTILLEIYLQEDVYKQLNTFYSSLGTGLYSFYLSGTTNNYFFNDATRTSNFFIQLPQYFGVKNMDFLFSDFQYIEDYTSDESQNNFSYGYESGSWEDPIVNWNNQYYNTELNATKLYEYGGSDNIMFYESDFDEWDSEMETDFYPDNTTSNSTFGFDYIYDREFLDYDISDWYFGIDTLTLGVTNNGTHYFVAHNSDGIKVYDIDGTYEFHIDPSYTDSGADTGSGVLAMCMADGYLRVINDNNRIYRYGVDGTYYDYITLDTALAFPGGMDFDGTYYWISETWGSINNVKKFDIDGVYQSVSYTHSSKNFDGIAYNGSHFFVSDTYGAPGNEYLRIYDYGWNLIDSSNQLDNGNGVTYDFENERLLVIHGGYDNCYVYEPYNYTIDGLYMENVNPSLTGIIAGNNSGYWNYSLVQDAEITSIIDNPFIDAFNDLPEDYVKEINYSVDVRYNLTGIAGGGSELEWTFNETIQDADTLYLTDYVMITMDESLWVFSYYSPSRAQEYDFDFNFLSYVNVPFANTYRSYGGDYNGSIIALLDNQITNYVDIYSEDWVYQETHNLGLASGEAMGICWNEDDEHWYITAYNYGDQKVHKYDNTFSSVSIYDIPEFDAEPSGFIDIEYYNGTYYLSGRTLDKVCEYDSDFNLLTTHSGIVAEPGDYLTGLSVFEKNNGTQDQTFLGILDIDYSSPDWYLHKYRIQEFTYHPNTTLNGESLIVDSTWQNYYREYTNVGSVQNLTFIIDNCELELDYVHVSNMSYIPILENGTNGIYQSLTITPDVQRNNLSGVSDQLYLNFSLELNSDGGLLPGERYPFDFNQTFDVSSEFSGGYITDMEFNGTHFFVFNFLSPSDHDVHIFDLNWNWIMKHDIPNSPYPNWQETAWTWDASNSRWLTIYNRYIFAFTWDFTALGLIKDTSGDGIFGNVYGLDEYNGNYYLLWLESGGSTKIVNYSSSWVVQSSTNVWSYVDNDVFDLDVFNNSYWLADRINSKILVLNFTADLSEMYKITLDPGNSVWKIALRQIGDESYLYIDRSQSPSVQIMDQFLVIEEYSNNFNGLNNYVFSFRINIQTEDGVLSILNYTDNSFSEVFHFNISQILLDNGKEYFYNFSFEFFIGGNPTNLTLFNMSFYEFDSEFEEFTSLYISDSMAMSLQDLFLFWNYTENNPSHLIINQSFIGIMEPNITMHQIFNISLLDYYPGELLNYSWFNASTGFYDLNLTFYDLGGNYEIWNVNYSIFNLISLSVSYENPVLINNENVITSNIIADYPIISITYFNSTDYIQEYANSSYPLYFYDFNFSISSPVESTYNISIGVLTEHNDTFAVNITYLSFIERTAFLDFHNLHSSYDQSDLFNVSVSLRDLYNIPIVDKNISSTLIAPNGTIMINQVNTTNLDGEIYFNFTAGINWEPGFYHINCSFNGTEDYYGAWEYISFELLPVIKTITNGSLINFTINGEDLANNTWNVSDLDASSFEFSVNHTGLCTFDLLLENVSLWIDLEYEYTDYIEHEFIFNRYNSYFESIVVDNIYLYDVPDNFTYYYFNHIQRSDYTHIPHNDTIYPSRPLGKTYSNDNDGFIIELRYVEDAVRRTQLTSTPSTDIDSVIFEQNFIADLDYKYWYLTIDEDLNSIDSLTHRRTAEIITDFTTQNDSHFFDLSEKTQVNDLFDAVLDLNPNWVLDYTITDNGTFATLIIDYSADFLVNNVSLILDLTTDGTFHENWTSNANQTNDFVITIPDLQFRTDTQQIIVYGTSDIPVAEISSYESDQSWNRITTDAIIDFAGFIEYPRFSTQFLMEKETSWEMLNIYYGTQIYAVQTINDNLAQFSGTGFHPSVESSYIHFKESPFKLVDFVFDEDTSLITITINSSLDVQYVYFQYFFDPSGAHVLELISATNDFEILGLTDSGDYDGYLYFYAEEIKAGLTIIKINVNFSTPAEMWVQAIIILIVGGIFVGAYYYLKNNEKKLDKIKQWVDEKITSKIEKTKEEKGYSEISLKIKDNKILLEIPKEND